MNRQILSGFYRNFIRNLSRLAMLETVMRRHDHYELSHMILWHSLPSFQITRKRDLEEIRYYRETRFGCDSFSPIETGPAEWHRRVFRILAGMRYNGGVSYPHFT